MMFKVPLTPLRFAPIFKTALWGGVRLHHILNAPPTTEPTAEAWLLSDHGNNQSVVADGPLQGTTLRQLMTNIPERLLGKQASSFERFPLLLKFIDAAKPLSIQVHPTDDLVRELEPNGERRGKTEAWVILEATSDARIYAGLQPDTTDANLRASLAQEIGLENHVCQHLPQIDDCYFLQAGTVHAIGGGILLFEVQQTSDVTYRLSDWGRLDPTTGQPRELHLEKGLKCIDYTLGPCLPVQSCNQEHNGLLFDALVQCEYFSMDRWQAARPFTIGADGQCRVVVGVGGAGVLKYDGNDYPIRRGDVWLLPAEVGACECVPENHVTLLECGIPE
jgi:mannose-6-phosphate isomerase